MPDTGWRVGASPGIIGSRRRIVRGRDCKVEMIVRFDPIIGVLYRPRLLILGFDLSGRDEPRNLCARQVRTEKGQDFI